MDNTPFVFLIGGHDLEMLTIKKMLVDNGFPDGKNIADLNLQWGAKLRHPILSQIKARLFRKPALNL